MVMDGLDVLSDVVGVYNLVKFQDVTNKRRFDKWRFVSENSK